MCPRCTEPSLEAECSTICIFLDLEGSVPHQGVIDALGDSGVGGSILKWFSGYLSGRSQKVVFQGFASHSIAVPSGIPWGSILGPLLFTLTFNEFSTSLTSGS